MSKCTQIHLRQGERIFINGAVVKADRNVTLDFLNSVPYLLERQIMQPAETTTPMRQIYFIVQTMVLDPVGVAAASEVFTGTMTWMLETHTNSDVLAGLGEVAALVEAGKPFEALSIVRDLIPVEDTILGLKRHVELRLLEAV
ncbi:MAG: flagellar biosynthesis repressor FlbT [Hyphomicrobium sp.]|jgi:flagellar protein FlbT